MLANDMVRVSGRTESVYPELKRFYSGRPVLVAGADGFLGRSCVRILDGLGAGISTLSRRGISPRKQVNRRFEGELTDPDFARAAVDGQSVVLDCIGRSGAVASLPWYARSMYSDTSALTSIASRSPADPEACCIMLWTMPFTTGLRLASLMLTSWPAFWVSFLDCPAY